MTAEPIPVRYGMPCECGDDDGAIILTPLDARGNTHSLDVYCAKNLPKAAVE